MKRTSVSSRHTAFWLFSLLSLFSSVLLTAGCGGGGDDDSNPPASNTRTIAVSGFNFGAPVTVKSGTRVRWQNNDGAAHSIVWDAHDPNTSPGPGANLPLFNGGAQSQEWVAPTVTVDTEYNYHCGPHPTMVSHVMVTP